MTSPRGEDWTTPGAYEVAAGVHRIPLPLPDDALRAVNAYVIEADGELVLVDAGWALDAAREQLAKALAGLGAGLGDVRRFLVTHHHRDHYTQAIALRREFGGRVFLGEQERHSLAALADTSQTSYRSSIARLRLAGAEQLAEELLPVFSRERDPAELAIWEQPDVWMAGAHGHDLGNRSLRTVPTPGHTRGHVVFVDEAAALMFAGDHVLPHITPSIGVEPAPDPLPLGGYLDSLGLVRRMPDTMLLPAHGPVAASTHARVDELLDHHHTRLDEALETVRGGSDTAARSAALLTWTRRRRPLDALDTFNRMLAILETACHLDLLVVRGRLRASTVDGVRRYATA